jgi:tRNA modification GTPase
MSKTTDLSRTIVALASSLGSGSIAVIRVSGPEAIRIINHIFVGKNLEQAAANTIHYGKIKSKEKEVDQVLVSIFHAPNSYTGEHYIEVSCHGNPFIVDDIIAALIHSGASMAKPGEFTMRSFLNQKMDLSQAEAVSSIISAKSRAGIHNSLEQLNGKLAGEILNLKDKLINIIGLMEIDLDFAEEELNVTDKKEIIQQLEAIRVQLIHLANSYNYAKFFNDGIGLAIIGEPNVGKSTLLNQILGENRAITSHIPGTTRDMIQETIVIRDILFRLSDTAGLRETKDAIESEGIKRTRKQIDRSDLILLVVDVSKELSDESKNVINDALDSISGQIIIVANKSDKGVYKETLEFLQKSGKSISRIAAISGAGLSELIESIIQQVSAGYERYSDKLIITNKRQKEVLQITAKHISQAVATLKNNEGFEFAAVDLRQALNELGEITGETVSDDILNNIFANFCIGK